MEIKRFVAGSYGTNTYIIIENGEAVVIDPTERADSIIEILTQNNVKLKYILITHAHFDHVGAVADLKSDGVKVCMSKADVFAYDEICTIGEDMYVKPFDTDVELNDGDTIDFNGHVFRVMYTPGHTPGSVCFIVDDKIIFSGDTLFKLGIGRIDFPGGDHARIMSSLKSLFALHGDFEVFPGHGLPTTLNFEREYNPYAEN